MTNQSLSGRTAVVTGATSGIGAATARALSRAGASVALVARRHERLEQLALDVGGHAVAADVADRGAFRHLAERVHDAVGAVDLVVANAGVMLAAPFEQADTDEWHEMLDVNVAGLIETGRAFVCDLLSAAADGRPADLVHVGSIGGHVTFAGYGVYGATKAAVAHLTRNLRAELGPRGVRVKVIEPGLTATELGATMRDEHAYADLERMRDAMTPLAADDIAATVVHAVAAPANVNIAGVVVVPTGQG